MPAELDIQFGPNIVDFPGYSENSTPPGWAVANLDENITKY